jgi:hypothetical protein
MQGLRLSKSGRPDLNRRPPEPHSGALPGCATSRKPVPSRRANPARRRENIQGPGISVNPASTPVRARWVRRGLEAQKTRPCREPLAIGCLRVGRSRLQRSTAAGCCCVRQCSVPSPHTRSTAWMPTTSWPGKSSARVLSAIRSLRSLKVGTITTPLAM